MLLVPRLRVASLADNLEAVICFNRDGLGIAVPYGFEDHDGFDGLMLGQEGAPYHFEFTHRRGYLAGRAPMPVNIQRYHNC